MEPDHSACIKSFLETYPSAVVVSSAKAFLMMQSYFGESFENRRIVVKEGDELPLGKHTLTFIGAAMVHWPEVVMSYEKSETLFSPPTRSANSARLTRTTPTGPAKQGDIISA